MRKIKTVPIEKSNYITQFVCAALIIIACFVSKTLMLLAALVAVIYIFSDIKWEQKFAFFFFILSFAPIFKLDTEQTSLFMFLRIAVIACYLFKEQKRISIPFVTTLIAFFLYSLFISEIFDTKYLTDLINIILWFMVGYVIVNTLDESKMSPVVISFSNGIILTGIIGLFSEKIPQIAENIWMLKSYVEGGYLVTRYAGFWNDPNYFTVLVITSLFTLYFEFNKKRINITDFITRCAIVSFLGLMTMSKSCAILLAIFWLYVFASKNDIKTATKVVLFFAFFIAFSWFLMKNPYWISDLIYRFTNGSDELTSDVLTTGRTTIWKYYLPYMFEKGRWLYGVGIAADLLNEHASHNFIINLLYNLGLVGTILYITTFRLIYTSFEREKPSSNIEKKRISPAKVSLFVFFSLFMFLDALNFELIYYLLPMLFVYLLGESNNSNIVIEQ